MLIGSFAFANTNEVVTPKTETIEVVSEKSVTCKIDNPVMDKLSISVSENELNNDATSCGFPLSWDTAEHGTGSFYFGCDDSTTMDDILSVIFALFW